MVSLNQNLSQLNNEQLTSNARQSLIREKIKKDEIDKFYDVDYSKAAESEKFKTIIDDFRKKLGFNSNEEFKEYLESKNLNFDTLKKSL